MSVNIAEKLHKVAKDNATKELAEAEQLLKGVKGDLVKADEETLKMLNYFGTQKSVNTLTKRVDDSTRLLKGEVVTEEDIKKICLDYNLKFLSTQCYIKNVPFQALEDIKNFQKTQPNFSPYYLFIIAPSSHFSSMEIDRRDPVILYQTGNHYKVVTKFGNDFTYLRRIQGWLKNNAAITYNTILVVILSYYSLKVFNSIGGVPDTFSVILFCIGAALISLIIGAVLNVIFNSCTDIYEYKNKWNRQKIKYTN